MTSQFGVTDEMHTAYADLVFELSNNLQIRQGDPVRFKQFEEIERQRPALGMSDAQIAERLGLAPEQVREIRILEEHRRFNPDNYARLFSLGAGKRYREERYVSPTERFAVSEHAARLREAAQHDPVHARAMLEAGYWTGDTIPKWLRRWADEAPDRPAIIGPGQTLSYGEALDQAERFARALTAMGIRRGDVVAIQLPNVEPFVIAYLGTLLLGGVVTTLHMPYRAGELEPLLRHSRARVVVCGPPVGDFVPSETFAELAQASPFLEHVICAGGEPDDFARLVAEGPFEDILMEPVAADPAYLGFTSGTSASPKAVIHTSYSMLTGPRLVAPLFCVGESDVVLSMPPFTHAFGICVLNLALCAGATSVLLPRFEPEEYVRMLREQPVNVLFTAPAHVAASAKAGVLAELTLPDLRVAVISGSACPPHVAEAMQATMPKGEVLQLWGMTELFMGLLTAPGDSAEVRLRCVGGASPHSEVRTVDAEGRVTSPGEEGELHFRGPTLVNGYFDNAEATAASFGSDGWFRTGDLAVIDQHGAVSITGRVKDVINRGGVKINPVDVEAALDRHPAISQSAIVAMPDQILGEKCCAFVVLQPEQSLTLEEVTAWLATQGIAKMLWPEGLEIIDEMPMTPTRKVVKSRLAALVSR